MEILLLLLILTYSTTTTIVYKSKKKDLSCAELQAGKREADAGPAVLRTPGNGLSHSQVSRGVILAHEVSRELSRELSRRCSKTAW